MLTAKDIGQIFPDKTNNLATKNYNLKKLPHGIDGGNISCFWQQNLEY
jgi:hypothetical protein